MEVPKEKRKLYKEAQNYIDYHRHKLGKSEAQVKQEMADVGWLSHELDKLNFKNNPTKKKMIVVSVVSVLFIMILLTTTMFYRGAFVGKGIDFIPIVQINPSAGGKGTSAVNSQSSVVGATPLFCNADDLAYVHFAPGKSTRRLIRVAESSRRIFIDEGSWYSTFLHMPNTPSETNGFVELNPSENTFLIADFNNDREEDIVTISEPPDVGPSVLTLFLADNGEFATGVRHSISAASHYLAGDFDDDGRSEIAYGIDNGAAVEWNVMWNDDLLWSISDDWDLFSFGQGSSKFFAGDFNGDGNDDILNIREQGGVATLRVALSTPTGARSGRFNINDPPWYSEDSASSYYIGDFNGDGNDDVLLLKITGSAPFFTYRAFVALSDGASFSVSPIPWKNNVGLSVNSFLVGDFDSDGDDDLLRGGPSGDTMRWSVFKSNGADGFDDEEVWSEGIGSSEDYFFVGDFDGGCTATPCSSLTLDECDSQAECIDAGGEWDGDSCDEVADSDDDGEPDATDNCPDDENGGQEDGDEDGIGDVCDNCPDDANPDQVSVCGPICGDVIEESVVLEADIVGCADDGLIIGADGITLDCAGHSISGSESDVGILLEGRNNVVIKNCDVSDFNRGIRVEGGTGNILTNNDVHDNGRQGIYVPLAEGGEESITLVGNRIHDNKNSGLSVSGGIGNVFKNNRIYSNRYDGFFLENSQDNRVEGNVICGNFLAGADYFDFYCDNLDGTTGDENVIGSIHPCANDWPDATDLFDCNGDEDGDGVLNSEDNCLKISNVDQADFDGDGRGNLCDNCGRNVNLGQVDADGDNVGDVCDGLCSYTEQVPPVENAGGNPERSLCGSRLVAFAAGGNMPIISQALALASCVAVYGGVPLYDLGEDGYAFAETNVNGEYDIFSDWLSKCSSDDSGAAALRMDSLEDARACIEDNPGNFELYDGGCDSDSDDDGVPDATDNCPNIANADQVLPVDTDGDGVGDACEAVAEPSVCDEDTRGAITNRRGDSICTNRLLDLYGNMLLIQDWFSGKPCVAVYKGVPLVTFGELYYFYIEGVPAGAGTGINQGSAWETKCPNKIDNVNWQTLSGHSIPKNIDAAIRCIEANPDAFIVNGYTANEICDNEMDDDCDNDIDCDDSNCAGIRDCEAAGGDAGEIGGARVECVPACAAGTACSFDGECLADGDADGIADNDELEGCRGREAPGGVYEDGEEIGCPMADFSVPPDGCVQFADFRVLQENYGECDMSRAEGDVDGNGCVEFADFRALQQNYNNCG